MTAAFELSRPEHNGAFDVTVYQYGWRLGGKGASGRGPDGRIEEHGLHLWLGYYDNAFQIMRECYAELNRNPAECPISDWQEAFAPDPYVGLMDRDAGGAWRRLMAHFPTNDELPGDPPSDRRPRTVADYLVQTVRLLAELIRATQEAAGDVQAATGNEQNTPEFVLESVQRLIDYGQLATFVAISQAALTLEQALAILDRRLSGQILQLLDVIRSSADRLLQPLLAKNSEVRLLWEIMDIVFAQIRGTLRYGLLWDPRGFDAVNDYDSREWLLENGASESSLNSAFVRGLYDLAFAYDNGDISKPGTAAGQGLRGALRMFFGYRGALFWKMQAGMGDIVFAPMYEVLRRRGVKFKFFHRLENLQLEIPADESTPFISGLEFTVQAQARDGDYDPLFDIRGLPYWPAQPLWDQLVGGDELKNRGVAFESFGETESVEHKVLQVNQDFDFVVLGIGLGAVPIVAKEILAYDARWRSMIEHMRTIPTQAFQLWMNKDLTELGWDRPPPNMSAYVEPFDTWADMSHLGSVEDWNEAPRGIAYFCSVLSAEGFPPDYWSNQEFHKQQNELVKTNALNFMQHHLPQLWPNVLDAEGEFRWDLLKVPDGSDANSCKDPFDTQFWVANINPSDRYVLALPGTMHHRISPLDVAYDNLTIAGDWTDCGYNYGCVEAAVMSVRLAAHALSLSPKLEDIHGYDHP